SRQLEHRHVTPFGLGGEDAALEWDDAPGERVSAVSVGELGDEQVVTDKQCRLHRAGRNIERLVEKDPDNHREYKGVDNDLDRFAPTAVRRFGVRRQAHGLSVALHPVLGSKLLARCRRAWPPYSGLAQGVQFTGGCSALRAEHSGWRLRR